MADFAFSSLSPDIIIDAFESAGFSVASGLLALNSYENRVYQFHDDNLTKWVAKFYRPQRWSLAQIREEHDFAFELQQHELPIVAPIQRHNQSLFEYQGFHFAVFPCKGGRIFEVDNLEQLEWMGRFIGRIHAVSAQKTFQVRTTLSCNSHLIAARETLQQSEMIPHYLEQAFFTVLDQVISIASEQYQPRQLIRLHGDCHAGNILWTDNGPHFVDLDDCCMGPAIQDLWMMLSGDRSQQLLQLSTLIEGYESFNTDKYWEQQILTLKEQIANLQQPALTLLPGY